LGPLGRRCLASEPRRSLRAPSRLSATLLRLYPGDEIGGVNFERDRELRYQVEGGVPLPGLKRCDVGAVDPRFEGEAFLREGHGVTELSHAVAEQALPRGRALAGPGHPHI